MNLEDKIRNNKSAFDERKMPEGSRERFLAKSGNVKRRKTLFMTWTSVAAAVVVVVLMISGLNFDKKTSTESLQTADNKLVMMRQFYDEKVEEAIISLEDVLENVDDSTKRQINNVIYNLLNIGDVFAEISPLPEDRQIAIAEQIYDNKLKTIELITDKIK